MISDSETDRSSYLSEKYWSFRRFALLLSWSSSTTRNSVYQVDISLRNSSLLAKKMILNDISITYCSKYFFAILRNNVHTFDMVSKWLGYLTELEILLIFRCDISHAARIHSKFVSQSFRLTQEKHILI